MGLMGRERLSLPRLVQGKGLILFVRQGSSTAVEVLCSETGTCNAFQKMNNQKKGYRQAPTLTAIYGSSFMGQAKYENWLPLPTPAGITNQIGRVKKKP